MLHPSPHALTIGAAGMLRGATLELARRGFTISAIARSRDRLNDLASVIPDRIHPIPLDYTDHPSLLTALHDACARRGPFTLALCWVHSTAPRAIQVIADLLVAQKTNPLPRLIHVVGSAADDPAEMNDELAALAKLPGISYQRIVTGFIIEPGGSRWLTHDEVCRGVLRAIDSGEPVSTVGVTRPWSAHP